MWNSDYRPLEFGNVCYNNAIHYLNIHYELLKPSVKLYIHDAFYTCTQYEWMCFYVMHKNMFVTITTSIDISTDRSLLLVIATKLMQVQLHKLLDITNELYVGQNKHLESGTSLQGVLFKWLKLQMK